MSYHAKVTADGKVMIPEDLRKELGIEEGDSLSVERDASGAIVLRTREQVLRDVQAKFRALRGDKPQISVVDELLAERREEARREQADFDAWVAERT